MAEGKSALSSPPSQVQLEDNFASSDVGLKHKMAESTTQKVPQKEAPAPPINVLLLLKEHLPRRWRELKEERERVRHREHEIGLELSRMEKHAAIEGIELDGSVPTLEEAP